jgi:predicted aspartyl protease
MESSYNPAGAIPCVVELCMTDERSLVAGKAKQMARSFKDIEVGGKRAVALFDTGATFTYVRSSLITEALRKRFKEPAHVALGGREIDVAELALIEGKIEGLGFFTEVVPVNELGRANGHELDALIGALAMERWEIKLDPKSGRLDL